MLGWTAGEEELRTTCKLLQVDINMVGHSVRYQELRTSYWSSVCNSGAFRLRNGFAL